MQRGRGPGQVGTSPPCAYLDCHLPRLLSLCCHLHVRACPPLLLSGGTLFQSSPASWWWWWGKASPSRGPHWTEGRSWVPGHCQACVTVSEYDLKQRLSKLCTSQMSCPTRVPHCGLCAPAPGPCCHSAETQRHPLWPAGPVCVWAQRRGLRLLIPSSASRVLVPCVAAAEAPWVPSVPCFCF